MGQSLGAGITTRINVYARNGKKDIEDLDTIKKVLSDFFPLEIYNLDTKSDDKSFIFTLKKDILINNFHKSVKELFKIYDYDELYIPYNDNIIIDKSFNKENYPLSVEYDSNNINIELPEGALHLIDYLFEPFWIYRSNRKLLGVYKKYGIDLIPISLWSDYSKYVGEDETEMLRTINTMKNSYFKNILSKAICYYVY